MRLSLNDIADAPDVLLLAEIWARAMGKSTKRVSFQNPNGEGIVVLTVMHGDKQVFVHKQDECISVFALMDLPEELTSRIRAMSSQLQRRLEVGLQRELVSLGRTTFTFRPLPLESIAHLQRISVSQLIRISSGDLSSFNRYADVIQEVVTAIARAASILVPILSVKGDASGTSGDRAIPPGMYG